MGLYLLFNLLDDQRHGLRLTSLDARVQHLQRDRRHPECWRGSNQRGRELREKLSHLQKLSLFKQMRYQELQQCRRTWLIPREQSVLTGFLFLVLLFIPVTGSTVEFW